MHRRILIVPVLILGLILFIKNYTPADAEGVYANLGTLNASDGSNDAINFSQGRVWTIDKFGKYIFLTQKRDTGNTNWTWSNDIGANWVQGAENYGYMTRGSVAYDSINDKLHVIWGATGNNDGIIYRRYGITRDGSNNITAITREDNTNINLQLDVSSTNNLGQPVALWVDDGSTNGLLVAIWTKDASTTNETRASMRHLSLSAADGVAANWVSLNNSPDTFTIDPPLVPANKIYIAGAAGNSAVGALVRGGSGLRKDDLYIFVATTNTQNILVYRLVWNGTNKDWRGGVQAPVVVGSMNDTSGYSLKEQLITKPVLDSTNDRLYIGWARWKDNTAGDTVSFAYLNSTDIPSATVDVYSANGTHSYAPTLDLAFDSTAGNLYVSYIESTTNGTNGSIDYKTYDGTTLSAETRFYTTSGGSGGADGSADIPILYENRINNRILVAFRVNGALPPTAGNPHKIYAGYITLAAPTSTPTPTTVPTAVPTAMPTTSPAGSQSANSTNNSNNSSSIVQPSPCTNAKPGSAPDLFQIAVKRTSAVISFTPPSGEHTNYFVSYSNTKDVYQHGFQFDNNQNGVVSVQINSLQPNLRYYFKVRAGNGCMPGDWSNYLSIQVGGTGTIYRWLSLPKVVAQTVIGYFLQQTTNAIQDNK